MTCSVQTAAEPSECLSPEEFYSRHVVLNSATILALAERTRNQSGSAEWFAERRKRVTATLVHSVVKRWKPDFLPVIQQKLFYVFGSSKATDYGRCNEKRALEEFTKEAASHIGNFSVHSCGLLVDAADPWLAATPDTMLTHEDGSKSLAEIKCPYLARALSLDEAVIQVNTLCLTKRDDTLTLKRTHAYYTQVQAQMHVWRIK